MACGSAERDRPGLSGDSKHDEQNGCRDQDEIGWPSHICRRTRRLAGSPEKYERAGRSGPFPPNSDRLQLIAAPAMVPGVRLGALTGLSALLVVVLVALLVLVT